MHHSCVFPVCGWEQLPFLSLFKSNSKLKCNLSPDIGLRCSISKLFSISYLPSSIPFLSGICCPLFFYTKTFFCLGSPWEPPVSCLRKSPSSLMNSLSSSLCQDIQSPRLPPPRASKFPAYKAALGSKPALCHEPCPPQHCLLTPWLRSWIQVLQDVFCRHLQNRKRESMKCNSIFCNIALSEWRQFEIKPAGAWLVSQTSLWRAVLLTDMYLCRGSVPRYMSCQGSVKLMRLSDKFPAEISPHNPHVRSHFHLHS